MVNLSVQEKIQKKYVTFSVPIKKELDNGKIITFKLKFIDSFRFMSVSLLNLVDNLSKINKKECKRCVEKNHIRIRLYRDKK